MRKREQSELARMHRVAALQHRTLAAWCAGVAAAAEEAERQAAVADSFAGRRALGAAWDTWQAWMTVRLQRRQRLAALLASLDGAGPAQLRPCFQRWLHAAQQARARAARAQQLARRRQAALLQAVWDAWSAYARAMRADPDPGSPFASPRAPEQDAQLMWDVAGLLAANGGASASSGESDSRTGSPAASVHGSTADSGADGNGGGSATASSAPAGAQSAAARGREPRRWRLKDLFKARH